MRVLVLNGSPSGENSITLQTIHFVAKFYDNTRFEICMREVVRAKNKIR